MRNAFERATAQKYSDMKRRVAKIYHRQGHVPPRGVLPFTLEEFRTHLVAKSVRCEGLAWACFYCNYALVIEEVEPEHWIPLARAGGFGLENIALSCHSCNRTKGELTGREFADLKRFMQETLEPAGAAYVLKCLSAGGQAQRLRFARSARKTAPKVDKP